MNTKIVAVAIVAVLVVAAVGVGIYTLDKKDDDREVNVIGRVNTDGSGIFVKEGVDANAMVTIQNTEPTSGAYLGGNGTWVVFNKEAWGGLVIGTPGAATIQHVQLKEIANLMDLNFVQYQKGQTTSADTLYYAPGIGNYAAFESELKTNPALAGSIMWEPQYSIALIDGCKKVATTNEMFPGHTCCVVASSHAYTSSHNDETVRFVAAYVESVNRMTAAIAAGSGDDYDKVYEVARAKVAMPTYMDDAMMNDAISRAFALVNYTYGDNNGDDPLSKLKSDMADVANKMYEAKNVSKSISDLGFKSDAEYGEKLVDSSFLKSALSYDKKDSYDEAKITVAVINGDIHQLAIHYGMALGIFDSYGIEIELSGQAGGPGVFTAVSNGKAQFGFIGAPPLTINGINNGNITA